MTKYPWCLENLATQNNSIFSNIYHLSFFRKNWLSLQAAKLFWGNIDSLKANISTSELLFLGWDSCENEFTHKCVDGQSRCSEHLCCDC